VENPDRDQLRYRVAYKMVGTDDWVELLPPNEVLSKTSYKWDTASLPEGRYRIRVIASDENANPPGRVTRHELESGVVLVDNVAPVIEGLALDGRRLHGRVVDGLGPIQRIEASVIGTNDWIPIFPTDSIFDEPVEEFDVDLSSVVPPGKRLVSVRAYDGASNVVVRSVFAR